MPDAANKDIFINCPFDPAYKPLFYAIVFTVMRSGFRARCALETDDASENRLNKICAIIGECRYSVHDISRTEAEPLPRFNMPLELGLFLGARRFGGRAQMAKRCIVFDRERYRYQQFISDIAGQDIHSHDGREESLIEQLAAWLRDQSRSQVPGGRAISAEFEIFKARLSSICADRALETDELTFGDLTNLLAEYLTAI